MEICFSPPITLCLVYKCPNATDDQISGINNAIKDIADMDNTIILGDFNCPDINCQTLLASYVPSSRLCELIFDHNLTQLVLSPTHVRGNTLDLIINNCEDMFPNLRVKDSDYFRPLPGPLFLSPQNLTTLPNPNTQ